MGKLVETKTNSNYRIKEKIDRINEKEKEPVHEARLDIEILNNSVKFEPERHQDIVTEEGLTRKSYIENKSMKTLKPGCQFWSILETVNSHNIVKFLQYLTIKTVISYWVFIVGRNLYIYLKSCAAYLNLCS